MATPMSMSYTLTPTNAITTTTTSISLSNPHNFPIYNHNSLTFSTSQPSFSLHFHRHCSKELRSVVTRAGPTTNQLIFAFVFPFSLLAITAFTAFRIGDRLDQKFLEEVAMNEAIREAEEEEREESDDPAEVNLPRIEEPALPRTRNRPKREI